mgnify:CR=1 FL=1
MPPILFWIPGQFCQKISKNCFLLAGKGINHQASQNSGHSQAPPQSGTTRSTRTIVLVLSLLAVALATKTAPKATIIINVPASFVGNGSKIFFNEDFHGRFIASGRLKGRMPEIQQFGGC